MYKFELQTEELSDIQTLAAAEDMKVLLWKTCNTIESFIDKQMFSEARTGSLDGLGLQVKAIKQLLELLGVKTS